MKKEKLDKIASEVFKAHPNAEKCYVSSDGQAFINKNSADLHKNTNKGSKDLKVFEVANTNVDQSGDEITFPLSDKAIKALKLDDLKKMAEDLKIDLKELDTKAKIAEAINDLKSNS
ncbi:hypothetical protein [Flagellimonas eckloniae]|uniref:Uncharacterized protein n=1 Tax=Flagellimonas eckloniae TaxID=346185 RepID=A0A0Q0WXG8_9FLAO|nr:hypothetical protein [Allomuricauda eckloniae]KQC30180.1 hypothetical protein AAY42_10050 [Allomuricauda eckloniae]